MHRRPEYLKEVYTVETLALITSVGLVLLVLSILVLISATILAPLRIQERLERILLPFSGVLTVFFIVMWVFIQFYLFSWETKLKDGTLLLLEYRLVWTVQCIDDICIWIICIYINNSDNKCVILSNRSISGKAKKYSNEYRIKLPS